MTTLEKIRAELQTRYWKTNQGKPSKRNGYNNAIDDALQIIDKYAEQEPCEDAISRQAVLDTTICDGISCNECSFNEIDGEPSCLLHARIDELPPVRPQEQTGQFAEWVAREIFDDMWEYNKDAFAEIACRKLAKLGIVREKGNEWELVEPQESKEGGANNG